MEHPSHHAGNEEIRVFQVSYTALARDISSPQETSGHGIKNAQTLT